MTFKKGAENYQWKGGRHYDKRGYILTYDPDHKYAVAAHVREHRLVFEKRHKCCLLPWAIVHHKNGVKTDNRPENLEVMNQSQHHKLTTNAYRDNVMKSRLCFICGTNKTIFSKRNVNGMWWFYEGDRNKPICLKCHAKIHYYKNHEREKEYNKLYMRKRRAALKAVIH